MDRFANLGCVRLGQSAEVLCRRQEARARVVRESVKFSPEVRERAVRMVFEHRGEYETQWAAVVSIAAKIGSTPQTLLNWASARGWAR